MGGGGGGGVGGEEEMKVQGALQNFAFCSRPNGAYKCTEIKTR